MSHFCFSGLSNIFIWTHHSLFIHSPTEWHAGCFNVWGIRNKAANTVYMFFYWHKLWRPLGNYQGAGLWARGRRMVSFLTKRTVFPRGCTSLEFSVLTNESSHLSTPCWCLVLSVFWFLVALICKSLQHTILNILFLWQFAQVQLLWWGICSGGCPQPPLHAVAYPPTHIHTQNK